MSIEVVSGTPLAEALQSVVAPKLAEVGWSSGADDDTALSEYIILMLVNGKTQEQIASELSNDLLGLGPDDPSANDFARWLFEQVHMLNTQVTGGAAAAATAPASAVSQPQQDAQMGVASFSAQNAQATSTDASAAAQDTAMSEGTDGPFDAPTGPKAMRNGNGNGNGAPKGRDRRMMGQLKNAMDRSSDASLHRIRGAAGQGRINREPPKGPRAGLIPARATMGGRGGMAHNMGGMNNMNNMMNANPQQQMQLFKLLEEQSKVMAQILGPNANMPAINPAFFGNQRQQQPQGQGKSLFDRVGGRDSKKFSPRGPRAHKAQGDGEAMDTDTNTDTADSAGERKDPSSVACRFQLACTVATCPFGHQSPAAPPGIALDLSDKCSYGAACTNRKCVASHPSPAQKKQYTTTVDCKFYPNCTNPSCPFKHPTSPPCRNGADCPERDSGCTYAHSDIVCRYNPCLNPTCQFRHTDGQKRGKYSDKVWTREGFDREGAEQEHISDRKFTAADGAEEELILPGKTGGDDQNMDTALDAASQDLDVAT